MITRVDWYSERAIDAAERGEDRGYQRASDSLLSAAERYVPRLTGALAQGGHVARLERGVAVAYGAHYARVLYAHPEWNYHGKSGRWLNDALRDSQDRMISEVADSLRSEIGGA